MFEVMARPPQCTTGVPTAGDAPVSHSYDDGLILHPPTLVDPTDQACVPREAWDWIGGHDPDLVALDDALDPRIVHHPGPAPPPPEPTRNDDPAPVTVAELTWIHERLGEVARHGVSVDADSAESAPTATAEAAIGPDRAAAATLVDAITTLESLDGVRAAAQARVNLDFRTNQMESQSRAGVPTSRRGRGIANQIGLARRTSPHRAAHDLGIAHAWITELPHTFAHLAAGRISAWAGTEVARRTAWLPTRDRAAVDQQLSDKLPGWSIKQVQAGTDKAVYEQAPAEAVERANKAATDRHVAIRPAPECMARISALLPVAQAVAVHTALTRAADTTRVTSIRRPDETIEPDPRTRAQVMADLLVERVTGQGTAADVPVEIGIIMPAAALTGDSDVPAYLPGHGHLPAELARQLTEQTSTWLRRIVTDPTDGTITSIDSQRRVFDGPLRRLLLARDGQTCRTPFCDAPIRHADHVTPHHAGGLTALVNGQGICERCNYAKQAPGWHEQVTQTGHAPPGLAPDDPARAQFDEHPHEVTITTPTGHVYRSVAPPALGP